MVTKKGHQSLHYIFLHQLQQVFELAAAWYTNTFSHYGTWCTRAQGLINIQLQPKNRTPQAYLNPDEKCQTIKIINYSY